MKLTISELLSKLDLMLEQTTVYATGAFGASIGNFPAQAKRYADNMYNAVYKEDINAGKTKAYAEQDAETWRQKVYATAKIKPSFAFDCVGVVKACAWSWEASPNSVYGGAVYESNGFGDWGSGSGSDDIITHCTDVSTDFTKIIAGEMLWKNGHVGIYVGDGMAVECTTAWDNKVQRVECWNVKKTGRGTRWTKHGKLPFVNYGAQPEIICPVCKSHFILK